MSQYVTYYFIVVNMCWRLWSQLTLVRKVCSFGNILITDVRTEQFWPLLAILANIGHALEQGLSIQLLKHSLALHILNLSLI